MNIKYKNISNFAKKKNKLKDNNKGKHKYSLSK